MKRIVVCCDGTWNKPGNTDRGEQVETNVVKIYKALNTTNPVVGQEKFYGSGVGTSFAITEQLLGGGTGLGIDMNIQDAYKFLMWSYEPGDELYLFGFSRGAYTVRSLAGLIRNCGIMKPQYLNLVGEAYKLYRDRTALTHPDSDHMQAFKKSYGIEDETPVRFLGVWDTVGALGIPLRWFNWWNRKYQFHDVKLSSQVKYAYQALALDEKRKVFSPSIWELSNEVIAGSVEQKCEQVWFPGVHGNVGGGYVDCGLSNISLTWMIAKAKAAGLEFDPEYEKTLVCDSSGELRNSSTFFYRITGLLLRAINKRINKRKKKSKSMEPEVIETMESNERVHYSCLERFYHDKKYRPKNLFPAIDRGIGFDPDQSVWQPEWQMYFDEYIKTLKPKQVRTLTQE